MVEACEEDFQVSDSAKQEFRIIANVYNPHSIFDAICRTAKTEDLNYLPVYYFFIDFLEVDKLLVFNGQLSWNGSKADVQEVTRFLGNNKGSFFNTFLDSVYGMNDDKILRMWHLKYESNLTEIQNGKIVFEGNINIKEMRLPKSNLLGILSSIGIIIMRK
jgi:hypothetical protein